MKTAPFFKPSFSPKGVLESIGITIALATLVGFFSRWAWHFELASHFRVQYFLALLLCCLAALALRRWKTAAFLFLAAALNFFPLVPYLVRVPRVATEEGTTQRVLLINVHTANRQHSCVIDFVRSEDPDLLVLQEVDQRWVNALAPLQADYPHTIIQPRDDNFGIALFSKYAIPWHIIHYFGGVGVPAIEAHVDTPTGRLRLIALHTIPPGSRIHTDMRNRQLLDAAKEAADESLPTLLLGDLNTSPWSWVYPEALAASGLEDSMKGRGIQVTWPHSPYVMRIPLDHAWHDPATVIVDRRIGPACGSDHLPVIVDFIFTGPSPGESHLADLTGAPYDQVTHGLQKGHNDG
jgi:endonuclease/exonuclease/phosphatase (EEP) superfamily protein YafD